MSFTEFIESLDVRLFLLLNGWHAPFWDTMMYRFSGTFVWAPLYLLLFIYIPKAIGWKKTLILLPAVAFLILLSDQSANLLKDSVQRYRPCHNIEFGYLVHTVRDACGGMYGFVSGHAANTFALAFFAGLLLRKEYPWLLPVLLLWSSLVSYSRIYLGAHYPADVICGAAIGAAWGILIRSALMKVKAFST